MLEVYNCWASSRYDTMKATVRNVGGIDIKSYEREFKNYPCMSSYAPESYYKIIKFKCKT
jgi:hypothetical protein